MTMPRLPLTKYAHPAEREQIVKPIPEDKVEAELARRRADLAAHLAKRPGHADTNALAAWVWDKDRILTAIGILEGQMENRWHNVERPA